MNNIYLIPTIIINLSDSTHKLKFIPFTKIIIKL